MKKNLIKAVALVSFMGISLSAVAANLDEVLKKGSQQIENENYDAAYKYLSANSNEFSGNPRFDYLIGLSASKSEHLGEALIALDRILIVEPSNGEALLMRAINYYKLENYDQAKKDFKRIKKSNPPPSIANIADSYLKSIDRKSKKVLNSFNLGLDLGYNTNVNSSYNGDIDILGSAALRTKMQPLGSTFNKIRFNWNIFWDFSRQWDLNAGVYLEDQIVHFGTQLPQQEVTLRDYSYLVALGYANLGMDINKTNRVSFGLNLTELVTSLRFEHLYLSTDLHVNYTYSSDKFSYTPGLVLAYTAFNKFGKDAKTGEAYTETDKLDAQKNSFLAVNFTNNVKYLVLKNLGLFANLDVSYEKAKEIQNKYFANGLGVRNGGDLIAIMAGVSARYSIAKQHELNAKLKYKYSMNLKEDFNFQNEGAGDVKRQQHFINLGLGYAYMPFEFMRVGANLDFNYNKSNVKYFDYMQVVPAIALDFYF